MSVHVSRMHLIVSLFLQDPVGKNGQTFFFQLSTDSEFYLSI